MTSHNEKNVYLNKQIIEECFVDLGDMLKKRAKNHKIYCEIVVVGGASILLNYGFRLSTLDIDCTDEYKVLMNDLISEIAVKHNLPFGWINTSFANTNSYSRNISRYSSHYKTYGDGVLEVRTIKDLYLLAMKIVSGRKYKNDYSDIYGIIQELNKNGKMITIEALDKAIVELYSSLEVVNKDAYQFAKSIIENKNNISYEALKKEEASNAEIIISNAKDNTDQNDIDYILSKLEIK